VEFSSVGVSYLLPCLGSTCEVASFINPPSSTSAALFPHLLLKLKLSLLHLSRFPACLA